MCLSVCLSAAVRPHYCTDPYVTWGRGRGCPLVVHYWADLQSGHGLRCYENITRTLVTSLRPSRDMTTLCERPAGRGLCAPPVGDRRATAGGRPQNRAQHTGSGRGRPAGDRPPTGGVLNITAVVWTAGFHWWRSGNKKRTQNVSEYICLYSLYAWLLLLLSAFIKRTFADATNALKQQLYTLNNNVFSLFLNVVRVMSGDLSSSGRLFHTVVAKRLHGLRCHLVWK